MLTRSTELLQSISTNNFKVPCRADAGQLICLRRSLGTILYHSKKDNQSILPAGRSRFFTKAVKRRSIFEVIQGSSSRSRNRFIRQLDIEYDSEGKPVEVYGVASIKELINACKLTHGLHRRLAGRAGRVIRTVGPRKNQHSVSNQIFF